MEYKTLESSLILIGGFMANILIAEITAKKKVATGELLESVGYEIKRTADSYQIDLLAADYINFVSDGRKAGYPSGGDGEFLKRLIRWVLVKGIEANDKSAKQAAWAIRESIFKKGIPPTNIIEFAIEEIERNIDEMVREAIQKDIEAHFDTQFSKLS